MIYPIAFFIILIASLIVRYEYRQSQAHIAALQPILHRILRRMRRNLRTQFRAHSGASKIFVHNLELYTNEELRLMGIEPEEYEDYCKLKELVNEYT